MIWSNDIIICPWKTQNHKKKKFPDSSYLEYITMKILIAILLKETQKNYVKTYTEKQARLIQRSTSTLLRSLTLVENV